MKTPAPADQLYRARGVAVAHCARIQVLGLLGALLLAGCGSTGSPQPPSLKLPVPPTDLSATRSGDAVELAWTMPRRATDRVPLTGDQRVVICRSVAAAPCTPVDAVLLAAGVPAHYTDSLPANLTSGPPRLLTYTVVLENHKQRGAGPSNPAYSAAGAAPPAIRSLTAEVTGKGIVLHWITPANPQPAGVSPHAEYRLRLHRTRIFAPGQSQTPASEETRAGVPQPLEQTLELLDPSGGAIGTLSGGWTLDHAIDRNAALNRTYRYTVERIARTSLDGHALEISGPASAPVTVVARDTFPPAVPQGLQSIADTDEGSIDLSWTADADADLAGYRVYRRVAGTAAAPEMVSGAELLANPAWRDPSAQPGVRYAYSVSAVDASGNESARSAEVDEALPKAEK